MSKEYEVISKYNGYLSVKEYNTNITRIFPRLGFKMLLSEESIRNIAYNPGGRFILENRLIINDPELIKKLELNLELEDTYTPEDIKELLINGSRDQLDDALNFGNEGTKELINVDLPALTLATTKTFFSFDAIIPSLVLLFSTREESTPHIWHVPFW